MQSPENQAFIIRGIDSIGNLRGFFSKVFQQAQAAEGAIREGEAVREEILAEEA